MIFQILRPHQLEPDNDLEALPIHTQLLILPKDLPPNYMKRLIIFQKSDKLPTLVKFNELFCFSKYPRSDRGCYFS